MSIIIPFAVRDFIVLLAFMNSRHYLCNYSDCQKRETEVPHHKFTKSCKETLHFKVFSASSSLLFLFCTWSVSNMASNKEYFLMLPTRQNANRLRSITTARYLLIYLSLIFLFQTAKKYLFSNVHIQLYNIGAEALIIMSSL